MKDHLNAALLVTRKRKIMHSIYSINNDPISKSQNVRDVGLLFDPKLIYISYWHCLFVRVTKPCVYNAKI